MERKKSRVKIERSQEDLDQGINAFHVQNEDKRENTFLDIIVEIIVQATLKEYYETKKSIEVQFENSLHITFQIS